MKNRPSARLLLGLALMPHFAGDVSFVRPGDSQVGFEGGVAGLIYPSPEQNIELGPRASLQTVNSTATSRTSWYLGGETSFWMMNLIGPGLEADAVLSSAVPGNHYRVEPRMDLRLVHLGETGAVAVRVGAPYEQQLGWGFRVGLTISPGDAVTPIFVQPGK